MVSPDNSASSCWLIPARSRWNRIGEVDNILFQKPRVKFPRYEYTGATAARQPGRGDGSRLICPSDAANPAHRTPLCIWPRDQCLSLGLSGQGPLGRKPMRRRSAILKVGFLPRIIRFSDFCAVPVDW
jgi:hypothetical protein